jgi:histidinol-phosphate aminotransferase
MPDQVRRPRLSRRSFLHLSAGASVAATCGVTYGITGGMLTEPMLAAAAQHHRAAVKDGVKIDANENPLGPSQAARDAVAAIIPLSGRYSMNLTDDLVDAFTQAEGVKPEYVQVFPGSTGPLHGGVIAFTSPQKSLVIADPGYEAGIHAAAETGARVVKVLLTKTYAHDVKAMVAAGGDAGLFYVCSPNNPTGSLTSHSDIEYLVENKPKGSIVMIDEAYIHFCEAPSAIDLVKAGKDVVVLRTFSKVYGMAGLRCGFAVARPDLLERITEFGGFTFMPVTAVVAATASLKDPQLVPERRTINAGVRQETFAWLDGKGYSYIPSQANCFLLDVKRPGREVIDAMAKEKVFIGRIWPVMPTCVRITVGTRDEMTQFQTALKKVMTGAVAMSMAPAQVGRKRGRVLLS